MSARELSAGGGTNNDPAGGVAGQSGGAQRPAFVDSPTHPPRPFRVKKKKIISAQSSTVTIRTPH